MHYENKFRAQLFGIHAPSPRSWKGGEENTLKSVVASKDTYDWHVEPKKTYRDALRKYPWGTASSDASPKPRAGNKGVWTLECIVARKDSSDWPVKIKTPASCGCEGVETIGSITAPSIPPE